MSTFDGLVAGHVHSDHLQGLESLKAPFVYCSPATREILLRIEKYPHRMNFAKGILESHTQTYKHLKKLLKSIPLETPTVIELSPGNEIQVTLFDANHCVGAVMFLIQGREKAILYTGDVSRNMIYLDTTYANRYELNRQFPSKAEGLRELLEVSDYPQNTIFYFEAWTFGYESVWMALSAYLKTQIHLDRYRWGLYKSLLTTDGLPQCPEAPPLVGFQLGNHRKSGCLTANPAVRLHSCEREASCPSIDGNPNVVHIIPIVTRLRSGTEIAEAGIGGGKGDLDQIHELETDDPTAINRLMQLCSSRLDDSETLSNLLRRLTALKDENQGRIRLYSSRDMALDKMDMLNELPLQRFVKMLERLTSDAPAPPAASASSARSSSPAAPATQAGGKTQRVSSWAERVDTTTPAQAADQAPLPRVITFPWARHASYAELCDLVRAFRPHDVHPCTVDEANWSPDVSMRALFGQFCTNDVFAHDEKMMEAWGERWRQQQPRGEKRKQQDTQETFESSDDESSNRQARGGAVIESSRPSGWISRATVAEASRGRVDQAGGEAGSASDPSSNTAPVRRQADGTTLSVVGRQMPPAPNVLDTGHAAAPKPLSVSSSAATTTRIDSGEVDKATVPPPPPTSPSVREWAAIAARNSQGMSWASFGELICTNNGHTDEELEL